MIPTLAIYVIFIGTYLDPIFWVCAQSSAVFSSLLAEVKLMILIALKSEKLRVAYSLIFETAFLPRLSCILISASVLFMFIVLRNVSIPCPPVITEERGVKSIENIQSYKFPALSTANKSSLLTCRGDRSAREDERKFVTVKAKNMNSPASSYNSNLGRGDCDRRLNGCSSATSSGGDYYMVSEDQSLISDDATSEISYSDNRTYDHTADSLIKESSNNPGLLIGWQISAKGRGIGLILDMKKSFGRTTKFKVQFENGNVKLLSLKRSDKKGNVPFSLIMKVTN